MHLTKRQREIYDFIRNHIQNQNYAPSIQEIGKQFQLSSPATVHKHLTHLEIKGLIRRSHYQSRSIELTKKIGSSPAVEQYPLLGYIAAGRPLEVVEQKEIVSLLPENRGKNVFVLRVKGDSMIEDNIQNGDYVIVEGRSEAKNGETVVAFLNNENATLKRFYQEQGRIRLQPANSEMEPIIIDEGDLKIQGVVIGLLRKF